MAFLEGRSKRHEAAQQVPTYRHLLSPQAMTVFNPLRVVAHCDIDAAYAQFESVRLGLPDDVPLICAQWQSIIAVNYPARKYGIKRFNTIDEARKLCPHLYVQHVATYRNGEAEAGYWGEVDPRTHKVSLDPYRRESLKILAIFKEMVPRGEIEKASIDEAFLDLSSMVNERLLERFPNLKQVAEDAPEGLDTPLPPPPPVDWSRAGSVFPGDQEVRKEAAAEDLEQEQEEMPNSDGVDGEVGGADPDTWEDWALCMGAEIMMELRDEVWKRLHYTCSAGIAHNKPMAKLCSAWKKPNNQTVLRISATPAFLRDMEFTDIRFLGGKLGKAIAAEYNATTVGDMLLVSLEEMQKRFGEESIWVYNILRGIDHTEVTARTATKSMLASKNVRPNVTTPEQGYHWISVLAGELQVRLRDAREVSPGLWPKTLVLGHRTGIEASRSRQTAFPFTRNLTAEYIIKYARKLWDEATQPMNKGNMKLNNISLSFTGLDKLEEGQKGIEGFFAAGASTSTSRPGSSEPKTEPQPPVGAVGTKRSRALTPPPPLARKPEVEPSPKKARLPTLHTGKRKTALDTFLVAKSGDSARSASPASSPLPGSSSAPGSTPLVTPQSEAIEILDDEDDDIMLDEGRVGEPSKGRGAPDGVDEEGPSGSWTCPKCGNGLAPAPDTNPEARETVLREMKQEHEDWHFALSLQDGPSPVRPKKLAGEATKGGVKVKKKPQGIQSFFAPKPIRKV